jgi:hypothetical protein
MPAHPPATTGLHYDTFDFADLVLKARMLRAVEDASTRYPIHRTVRFAARAELEVLLDDLAVGLGWRAHRVNDTELLLEDEGLFVSCSASRTALYSSYHFRVWADSRERAEAARVRIEEVAGERIIREPTFSIDWHFVTSTGSLHSASLEEVADDVLHDEAYPGLPGGDGVEAFIQRYLAAPEAILVLQGPPGTGKTRLIRAILGALSRRKNNHQAQALYTGDSKTLESDEVFVRFLTGWEDVFIVEDADHILKPRSRGNDHVHRFLTIADGVVRAQGRKVVFSTNLPNVGDLDDALVRPGRCFARVMLRELSPAEAEALLAALCPTLDPAVRQERLAAQGRKSFPVALVYQLSRA